MSGQTSRKVKIGVTGSLCIDFIEYPEKNYRYNSFGGIVYLITALSVIGGNQFRIIPFTRVEKKYRKRLFNLLSDYNNISLDFIVDEPVKTNVVNLIYREGKEREEYSILKSPPFSFKEIEKFLKEIDFLVISFFSGYEFSIETLNRIRKNFEGKIYCDIHSYVLKRVIKKKRPVKRIKNPERFLKNFNYIQGNELEWSIILNSDLSCIDEIFLQKGEEILRNNFQINYLFLTKGNEGAYGIGRENGEIRYKYISSSRNLKVIDTTGAGDAFTAGAVYSILNGYNLRKILRTATKYAEKKITFSGFFLPL